MKNNYKTNQYLTAGIIFLIAIIISSCTKELDIEIPEPHAKLVVEGWIEQGKTAKVILTQSVPFFSDLDSSSLMEIPITRARVTLLSGTAHEILTLIPNTAYFPPFIYNSIDMKGAVNQRYQLTIDYRGMTWNAITTIPDPVYLDSVWFEPEPGYDSLGRVWIQFTDNKATTDYYRVLTQVKGKDKRYMPCYTSIFSDRYFSGETFKLGLLRGMGSILDIDENHFYHLGDTINVKFCTLDKEHYEFWNSVQTEIITSSNPFASSHARIRSNIAGGYGIWGGYGATYYTVVAGKN
jgi:hypothetical protein